MKITVIAHPNSKNPKIEKDLLGNLHVWVKEPPLEGKANRAIEESLAIYFKVKKHQLELISGAKAKNKIFEVDAQH